MTIGADARQVVMIPPARPMMLLGASERTAALSSLSNTADELVTDNQSHPQNNEADGIIVVPAETGRMNLIVAGEDAEDAANVLRVSGLFEVTAPGSKVRQWVPTMICQADLTVGARTGVAGGVIPAGWRYVDTMQLTEDRSPDAGAYVFIPGGTSGAGVGPGTPADDVVVLSVPTLGFQMLRFDLKVAASSMRLFGAHA